MYSQGREGQRVKACLWWDRQVEHLSHAQSCRKSSLLQEEPLSQVIQAVSDQLLLV